MDYIGVPNTILKALLVSASKDDPRPYLNGVNVEYAGTNAILVATNKNCMSVARVPYSGEPFESFLLPYVLIEETKKSPFLLDLVHCENKTVSIYNNNQTRSIPACPEAYFDWRSVIPNEFRPENGKVSPSVLTALFKIRKTLGLAADVNNLVFDGEHTAMDLMTPDFFTIVTTLSTAPNLKQKFSPPTWVHRSGSNSFNIFQASDE